MEIETIDGMMDIDLSKLTLNDVCDMITKISVDAGVSNNAPTVPYSGSLCDYSTNSIVKSLNDVRIIDNTFVGKFLADNSDTSKFNKLLESAIRNKMENGGFDISSVAKGLRDKDYQRLSTLLEN